MPRLRIALVLSVLVLGIAAPKASAQYGDCYACYHRVDPSGNEFWWCAAPPPLVFGNEFCFIGDDPWVYCQTWGNQCCIDPW